MAEKQTKRTSLLAWGSNSYGQLGCGHTDDVISPHNTHTEWPDDIVKISGGGGHTTVILDNGKLYTCGWNNKGQLGLNHTQDRSTLQQVSIPPVRKVACGWNHTLALTEDNQLFVFGSNAFGQLGTGKLPREQKMIVPTSCEVSPGHAVVDVAAGLRHSLAVLDDGSVWSWGENRKGQLGLEHAQSKAITTPTQVTSLSHCRVQQVVAGLHYSATLTDDGQVYCWGSNNHGVCGRPPSTNPGHDKNPCGQIQSDWSAVPHRILGELSNLRVVELHSGWSHIVAITEERRVFTWGRVDYGQLGLRPIKAVQEGPCCQPREIHSLRGVKQLMCGAEHNIALAECNKVMTWGWNEHGMCGSGDEFNVLSPRVVSALEGCDVVCVGCGSGHSFAVIKQDKLKQDKTKDSETTAT